MEMYNVSGHGNGENFLIQGAEINPLLTSSVLEQVEVMHNEGTPEIFVDQGLYYSTGPTYGYYCTGFESPGDWEDHQRIFGVDGPDVQYAGSQTESLPYVYYTPSYGYAQSSYNPYNPYIPGAMVGVDGPYVGGQQYYAIPPYQDPVSSPGYIPIVIQPEVNPKSSADPLLDSRVAIANRPDGRGLKPGLASSSMAFARNRPKPSSNEANSLARISEGPRANVGSGKQSAMHGSVSSGSFPTPGSSRVLQARSASGSIQPIDNISNAKVLPHRSQLKVALPINSGFSDFGSSAHGRMAMDKLQSKINGGKTLNDVIGSPDAFGEQNCGPRITKLKNQLAVKAYTSKVGDINVQGNIIIHTDQYNKDDFLIDYVDAKFFVIKSYSEDDVHKSIKYNVWSSTPHGNKKLQIAYDDAQKIAAGKPSGCPIFLFFSVNASGQFCGVAEMVGPVDFHKDMDFWQQDKWSGSFPVKWHIVKDVPNTSLRHIILENNESKPVTNSRDTQEIMYKQGLEMLKMFKNHTFKTSLLDDFMYYENRQKILQEEKARLIFKGIEAPFLGTALDPTHKLNSFIEVPQNKDEKIMEKNHPNSLKKPDTSANDQVSSNSDIGSNLKIGSININPKQCESKPFPDTTTSVVGAQPVDVVKVGSVPVKVNGLAESFGFLTVGTIPLDPRVLQLEKGDAVAKHGSRN